MIRQLVITDGAAPYVVHADGAGLSRRGRAVAWVLALALLLVGGGALYSASAAQLTGARQPQPGDQRGHDAAAALGVTAGPGASAQSPGTGDLVAGPGDTTVEDAIQASWDGTTTHLDWRGTGYSTAEATFIGDRVVSPGDEVHRTLNIGNAGPSDAVMSIGLLVDENIPEVAQNPDLAEDIELFWDVAGVTGSETFAALLERQKDGTPVIAEVAAPQAATLPVTVGFRMSRDVTADRRLGQTSTLLSFQVLARMQGDTDAYRPPVGALPKTGVAILGGVALAVGLLAMGWLLLVAAWRRRRCDDCGEPVGRGERWTEYHLDDGRRHRQCEACRATVGSPAPRGGLVGAGPTR